MLVPTCTLGPPLCASPVHACVCVCDEMHKNGFQMIKCVSNYSFHHIHTNTWFTYAWVVVFVKLSHVQNFQFISTLCNSVHLYWHIFSSVLLNLTVSYTCNRSLSSWTSMCQCVSKMHFLLFFFVLFCLMWLHPIYRLRTCEAIVIFYLILPHP